MAILLSNVAAGAGGFVIHGQDAGDKSGTSVASAGDINGDGFDDVIIGAPGGDAAGNSKVGAGDSTVVFGNAAGGFVILGQDAGDGAGQSVASAGDINGDGFDDIIIGARYADGAGNTQDRAGDSYVVFGRASGFGTSIDLSNVAAGTGGFVIHGQDANDYSGSSVASAGDINGDGFDDLIIGAPGGDAAGNATSEAGDSYVVLGMATGFGAPIDLTDVAAGTGGFVIHGQDGGGRSGMPVASAGDVNDDGFDDLIIGAFAKSYIVFGRADGFGAGIELTAIASGTGGVMILAPDGAVASVASVGDINGDGFEDVTIGLPRVGTSTGDTYVVFGQGSGFGVPIVLANVANGTGGFVVRGEEELALFGSSVASAGDINGDGLDDLIIGTPSGSIGAGIFAGNSYVVFGRTSGFGATIDAANLAAGNGGFVIHGQVGAGSEFIFRVGTFFHAGDKSGTSVASAGDINGDGFDDLIVGAPLADAARTSLTYTGDSYVIFGGNFTNTVTEAGTSASQTLTGSTAADDMVGGLGDDTMLGNGGADVLIGGGGNDVLKVADLTFLRLDGGSGTDTLALSGSAVTLDLSTIANTRIQDIEGIDLTGTGDNTLKLSALEVLNLSTTSNTLKVDGNAGDTVDTGAEFWTNVGTSGGYTIFSRAQASLEVSTSVAVLCFRAGTHILTPDGTAAVEHLREGDMVKTHAGKPRPIVWIGHRHVDCQHHPAPKKVWPVRIVAGAFGRGQPRTDLFLSPDHAIFFNGMLIPVKHLIDGNSITQVETNEVTYYHVELASHDILLAEGLPVESYLDTGDRDGFSNGGPFVRLFPVFGSERDPNLNWEARGFAPLVVTGPAVNSARAAMRCQTEARSRHHALGQLDLGVTPGREPSATPLGRAAALR